MPPLVVIARRSSERGARVHTPPHADGVPTSAAGRLYLSTSPRKASKEEAKERPLFGARRRRCPPKERRALPLGACHPKKNLGRSRQEGSQAGRQQNPLSASPTAHTIMTWIQMGRDKEGPLPSPRTP